MISFLPLLILMASLGPAVVTFLVPERAHAWRNALSIGGAVTQLVLIGVLLASVSEGAVYKSRLLLAPGLFLALHLDTLSILFMTLSAVLWLVTTVYAVAYLGNTPNLSRFFGFFSLSVAATTGLAMSGSLITFFLFFEMLTLATWPLVIHRQNAESLQAGRVYLGYALPASAALLVAIVWLEAATGPVLFTEPAPLDRLADWELRVIFGMFIAGLGVKAAIVPLHGWLPVAMAAPAPVSSLLHAVAVVKAGAFGVLRVSFDVFGVDRVVDLGVGFALALVASATILWGSIRAVYQREIKKRLAYSTVSQVSYILLGAGLATPLGVVGGLVHLVHQGLMKITLFFCAGIYAERAGAKTVEALNGLGPRMPWTSLAFSLGAMGMIGLPPLAGFVSKFYLGLGGIEAGATWVLGVIAASTLLNAVYFLPLLYRLWVLPAPPEASGDERKPGLVLPAVATALASLAVGLFAASTVSPLAWARIIAEQEFQP